ncbi:MoxR family ATPase [soil metagenome]
MSHTIDPPPLKPDPGGDGSAAAPVGADEAASIFQRIRQELGRAMVGQDLVINGVLAGLAADGHVLLVGVPGLAKTLLVKSIAQVLGLAFKRIQFTPDLMPGDIVGGEILKESGGKIEFDYQFGPVFTNLLLADEINRTPPKTQSALLEAMQERRVTIAGETRALPSPFLVVATQNPIEHEGTYPLPEAQLDRFMFCLHLAYPERDEEAEVVRRTTTGHLPELRAVVTPEEILGVQELVRAMPIAEHVLQFAVDLARATRAGTDGSPAVSKDYIEWGAGPRASQYLVLGAKAMALLDGRSAPETKDVRAVAISVLQHRIVANYRATGEGKKPHEIVAALVPEVPEPSY